MKRANTVWRSAPAAELSWSAAGEPESSRFGDIYYSRDDGMAESRHVFLQGNDLPQRWLDSTATSFCLAETGFGTGLNFLLTWAAWRSLPRERPALHYLSIEKYPLRRTDLSRALAAWPALAPLASQLLTDYPGLLPGQHRLVFEQGALTLDLWWHDMTEALADLAGRGQAFVDAWYLDGFAPARNEDMWRADSLNTIATLSRPGATFATFTAAGHVRRNLSAAGFSVTRVAGYGRKRECLRGHLQQPVPAQQPATETPWDIPASRVARPARALVIGGGLAGCTVAAALARRGIAVTLLEKAGLAGAGSGNDQGILYTRLSGRHSPLTDFALASFRFASLFYRRMLVRGDLVEGVDGALCGSFHQSSDQQEMSLLSAALEELPELAQVLSAEQANRLLGIRQESAGYWYPASGWLRPVSVCRTLVCHRLIEVMEQCGEIDLQYRDGQWHALADGDCLAAASCAVVATGTAATTTTPCSWLPLQSIRGQTTELPTGPDLSALRAGFCHRGYIAPAREGRHCIGATFSLHDPGVELRAEDHLRNLQALATAVPAWQATLQGVSIDALAGRVGHRCASPDYLPVVGPAPNLPGFLRDYAAMRKNARRRIDCRGDYLPGLYLTTGHGSRGLSSTPLAAELLASQLCGEAPPLARELERALAPARFIIRDLARNRTTT